MKGTITISRTTKHGKSAADDKQVVSITLRDRASRLQFLTMEISLARMMQAISGLGEQSMTFTLKDLDTLGNVGKKAETKSVSITGKYKTKKSAVSAMQTHVNSLGAGWFVHDTFTSKDSIYNHPDGKCTVTATIRRFVTE